MSWKNAAGKGARCAREGVGVLRRMVVGDFAENLASEQRLEGGETVLERMSEEKSIAGRGNRRYQGPEAGVHRACWWHDESPDGWSTVRGDTRVKEIRGEMSDQVCQSF